jgi:hypothetical protein
MIDLGVYIYNVIEERCKHLLWSSCIDWNNNDNIMIEKNIWPLEKNEEKKEMRLFSIIFFLKIHYELPCAC